ncbi:MAG: tripartite tricarboxylate transporter substrate binding protein [Alcaligenaceae bacterium]
MNSKLISGLRLGIASGFALCTLLGAGHVAAQSAADNYPERSIKLVIPFPPGGSTDALGRAVAQKLQEKWGQSVVVENRPGASTLIGSAAVAKAAPDGYTLVVAVSSHTTNPAMHSSMPFDTLKDFKAISMLARAPVLVVANPNFPANNIKELVELGKAGKIKLDYGSAGVGTMTHLTAELIKKQTGLELTHILYKGGNPAMMDVMSGHLALTFATLGQVQPQIKSGRLKALGISSDTRYASVSDIPTIKEQGLDVVTIEWFGLLAPAATPPGIIAKLNAAIKEIMANPELGDRLASIELVSSTPEFLEQFIQTEVNRWSPVIKELNIKTN